LAFVVFKQPDVVYTIFVIIHKLLHVHRESRPSTLKVVLRKWKR